MPLRGSHGKVLLAPSLSSFRLWSYSSRALPTACTNRRVSESRYPLPSPSRPLSEVYALTPCLSTKNNVCLLFSLFFLLIVLWEKRFRRKKSFFYKNCFILLSCFPIDTSPVFSYSFACIPLWYKRIDWRIRNG